MNPLGRGALALALLGAATSVAAETLNGFDLSGLSVDRGLVHQGGPPRDGIPALIDPDFVTADQAGLKDDDRVIGVAFNGVVKAYPLSIMNWHEVVNDRFGDRAVLVTYCPLCFTGMAFLAESGVSGNCLACRACSTTAMCCSTTAPPNPSGRRFRRRL